MDKSPEQLDFEQSVTLKDPALAAFLAWLLPGLGHLYQGRLAKAALFSVCILGTFFYGVYLSSDRQLGWGRAVYFSWREGDKRLPYLCQVAVGLPALPALVQANRTNSQKKVFWGGFMAPPWLPPSQEQINRDFNREDPNRDQPSLDDLNKQLHPDFEFGTVYTMIAGLLNILAIYDAWGGPVFGESAKKEEDDESGADDKEQVKEEQDKKQPATTVVP